MSEQRFTTEEVESILKRAALLHSESPDQPEQTLSTESSGLTLEALRSIAAEAGIAQASLDAAIDEIKRIPLGFQGPARRSRNRSGIVLERDTPFGLSDEEWMAVVELGRRLNGHQGWFEYVPNNLELIWNGVQKSGDLTPGYRVTATRSGTKSIIKLEILANSLDLLMTSLGISAICIALFFIQTTAVSAVICIALGILTIISIRLGIGALVKRASKGLDSVIDEIINHHRPSKNG